MIAHPSRTPRRLASTHPPYTCDPWALTDDNPSNHATVCGGSSLSLSHTHHMTSKHYLTSPSYSRDSLIHYLVSPLLFNYITGTRIFLLLNNITFKVLYNIKVRYNYIFYFYLELVVLKMCIFKQVPTGRDHLTFWSQYLLSIMSAYPRQRSWAWFPGVRGRRLSPAVARLYRAKSIWLETMESWNL